MPENIVRGRTVQLLGKDVTGKVNSIPIVQPNKSLLLEYIHYQIFTQKTNLIVLTEGLPGKGKSVSSMGVAERWCTRIGQKFDVNYNVAFSIGEFMERVADLERKFTDGVDIRGTPLVYDDAGVSMDNRKWQDNVHKLLNDMIEVFRYLGLVLFITVPGRSRLDKKMRELAHATMKPLRVKNGQYSICKFYINEKHWKTGEDMPMLIRAQYQGWRFKLDYIEVHKPSAKIMHDYARRSVEFKGNVIQSNYAKLTNRSKKIEGDRKPLTDKQKMVYAMARTGMDANQISVRLGILPTGVTTHLRNIRALGYEV